MSRRRTTRGSDYGPPTSCVAQGEEHVDSSEESGQRPSISSGKRSLRDSYSRGFHGVVPTVGLLYCEKLHLVEDRSLDGTV